MGWKLNALLFLVALLLLAFGALIIGIPLLLYVFYRLWSKHGDSGGSSHWMLYLGVIFILLALAALANQGTYSPLFFGGIGVLLLGRSLFPRAVQGLYDEVHSSVAKFLYRATKRGGEESGPAESVELTKVPLDHVEPKKADPKERLLRFQRLTQALAELGTEVTLTIDFSAGSGRIFFTSGGRKDQGRPHALLLTLKSQLPEFGPELSKMPPVLGSFSVPVDGVPEPTIDPLGPVARYFSENHLDGRYVVTISSARVNPVSRWLAERNQRRLAVASGFQRVDDDRTMTLVDHPKQVEHEDSVKRLERLAARTPVKVSVSVSARDELDAVQGARILAGALSSHRMIDGLRVGQPEVEGGWRKTTLMLPSEAAACFWLPQNSLGMRVAPSAEFEAPPVTEGEVVLGEVVGLSGKNGQQVRVALGQLAKHVFVTGMTGSGKTTSCFSLLLQLHRSKVPFLVVEPVKSEYRSLMAAIPELQVFTIGDEQTAPFRLNIFEPPPGVKVQAHLENLEAVWNASFVSYAPLPYVVKQVFAEAYVACGWDIAKNIRGRPVMFEDVRVQVEKVVRSLGYEPKVTMDVEAALKTRLTSLTLGGKGALLGAVTSTPLDLVFERPTVIELRDIQNDEEKAFVAALLLMDLAAWAQVRGQSRELRHFTLIEEAHRLLPNVSTEKGDPESADPRRRTVESFGNMLAELRAYGEGLAVVEQIPTKNLPDAIKNTGTKEAHRVPALDDRKVMAGAMNATKEQAAVFTALAPGEAVLSLEGHPVPVRVEVEDVVSKMKIPVGEVSDWDVKKRMDAFYLRNPLAKDVPKPSDLRLKELVDSEPFRVDFIAAYRIWVRTGQVEALRSLLLRSAVEFAGEREERVEAATRILTLATAFYLPFNPEQRARFPTLFRRELEAAAKVG